LLCSDMAERTTYGEYMRQVQKQRSLDEEKESKATYYETIPSPKDSELLIDLIDRIIFCTSREGYYVKLLPKFFPVVLTSIELEADICLDESAEEEVSSGKSEHLEDEAKDDEAKDDEDSASRTIGTDAMSSAQEMPDR